MTVICRWGGQGCGWGATRDHEKDARDALYRHLKQVHGHDVWAQKEATS